MVKGKILIVLFAFLVVFISIECVTAANIGISPATVRFDDVMRGGYSERIVTVTVDTEKSTDVEILKRGEIADWINFSKTKFSVSKDEPFNLNVVVNPPEDMPNGNYSGFIRVKISSLEDDIQEGQATGKVNPVLDLYTIVEITDIEQIGCRAQKYRVYSAEEGDDIKFSLEVRNTGNVKITPTIMLEVWDAEQRESLLTKRHKKDRINPTTEEEIEFEIDSSELPLGQYWVDVSALECNSEDTLTFDILEEGSLRANGRFVSISTQTWVEAGETTKIETLFQNTGEKNVDAMFKGRITLGDKILQYIESDSLEATINEKVPYDFYFTPNEEGRYIVSGRFFYDNKRTFEKSETINVTDDGVKIKELLKYLVLVILIIGIVTLTYKIRKEKKRYKKDLERFRK